MSPLASAVIPAYNAGAFITKAVESVLAQTLRDSEVIVVDDASNDDTREIVQALASRSSRVLALRNDRNSGPGHARNQGIRVARGRWIAILDADDAYHPGRLEHLVATGEETGADVVADELMFSRGGQRLPLALPFPRGMPSDGGWLELEQFLRNAMPHGLPDLVWLQPMVRRSFIEAKGTSYCEDLRAGEDFLYHFELLVAGARFYVTRQAYYYCEQRDDSLTHSMDRRGHYSDLMQSYRRARALLTGQAGRETIRLLDRRGRLIKASLSLAEMRNRVRAGEWRGVLAAFLELVMNLAAYGKYGRICRAAVVSGILAVLGAASDS